jgi:hypothetical protein
MCPGRRSPTSQPLVLLAFCQRAPVVLAPLRVRPARQPEPYRPPRPPPSGLRCRPGRRNCRSRPTGRTATRQPQTGSAVTRQPRTGSAATREPQRGSAATREKQTGSAVTRKTQTSRTRRIGSGRRGDGLGREGVPGYAAESRPDNGRTPPSWLTTAAAILRIARRRRSCRVVARAWTRRRTPSQRIPSQTRPHRESGTSGHPG